MASADRPWEAVGAAGRPLATVDPHYLAGHPRREPPDHCVLVEGGLGAIGHGRFRASSLGLELAAPKEKMVYAQNGVRFFWTFGPTIPSNSSASQGLSTSQWPTRTSLHKLRLQASAGPSDATHDASAARRLSCTG
jgi:hypothetical protein